jgi:hypothetical protein
LMGGHRHEAQVLRYVGMNDIERRQYHKYPLPGELPVSCFL